MIADRRVDKEDAMQELNVVQRIGRRRRAFRPITVFPAPAPAWRNVVRPPRRARPRVIAPVSQPRPARKFQLTLPKRLKPRHALLLVFACVLATASFAYFAASGRGLLSRTPLPQDDPLFARAMMNYAGLSHAAEGSTALDAGDGTLLDTMETFSWETYTVMKGDSVSSIAAARALSIDSIIALNGLTNVKRLRVGAKIRIPNMDGVPYTVRKGDSLTRIANSWGVPLTAILDANDLATATIASGQVLFLPGARMRGEELKKALGELFIYPIKGRITSAYGWRDDPFTGARRFHAAVDLASNTGTPVKAAMDGRVSAVGINAVYGKYVIIAHDGGYQTMYAHLNVIRVDKGTRVSQGERIGDVGSTGYSTGPHLHFAVYRNGRALNPMQFLN
jgi:murein DD-endopeptidase MepM/ murein hydrolase activator NlpD